ncbi:hypothetical protein [uncultured Lutibacter sp.]|uniref:hypothetical protein n=1 Tax=uncultured Lutibacter sp. TaxID=437739 RepID=UPI00263171C4|nr:hypothetical protein [uncultured Lutibacter sp.]
MKYIVTLFLTFLYLFKCYAQESYYDYVKLGEYQINYADTIIYNNNIQYNQYNYSGKTPMFVQVWYPSIKVNKTDQLKLGDFQFKNVPTNLVQVYEKLIAHMDDSFIKDGITYDIVQGQPIDYSITTNEILGKIKKIPTKSSRKHLDIKLDFPTIIYHHGSQGLSYENSIMAEYFASKGYVFISANFHLPYENTIYGLLPYNLEKVNKHNQSRAKKLIEYAKSITTQQNVFYIGHSWGAQEGWCFLNDSSLTDGFVSMETTIEYKKDTSKIKEMWPYVYESIKIKKNKFSIPILLLAAQDKNLNFDFFKNLSTEKMVYATYKKPFGHNSYTSIYMMRYFLKSQINQPDSEVMLTQIKGYASHLELIYEFLESIRENKPFQYKKFEKDFIIK